MPEKRYELRFRPVIFLRGWYGIDASIMWFDTLTMLRKHVAYKVIDHLHHKVLKDRQ